MKITKAIIPAAGLGTRFLPATKAQPKEMLPIVDKPTIQYIVEEAVESGIKDIIIVTGRNKRAIEDHFDKSIELEFMLEKNGKKEILKEVKAISELVNIYYVRQKEPRGLGDAIRCARSFIGEETFAVLLGDDIIHSTTPCLKQLINIYDEYKHSVLGVQSVAKEDVSKYGIISPKNAKLADDLFLLDDVIEKPQLNEAPSNYAIMGRYVLTHQIFDILENLPSGKGGEIQLTDAIRKLNQFQNIVALNFEGKRYDVGDKFGFIEATIDFAIQRPELRKQVLSYIDKVSKMQLQNKN